MCYHTRCICTAGGQLQRWRGRLAAAAASKFHHSTIVIMSASSILNNLD